MGKFPGVFFGCLLFLVGFEYWCIDVETVTKLMYLLCIFVGDVLLMLERLSLERYATKFEEEEVGWVFKSSSLSTLFCLNIQCSLCAPCGDFTLVLMKFSSDSKLLMSTAFMWARNKDTSHILLREGSIVLLSKVNQR